MSKIKNYLLNEVQKGTFPGFCYLIATKDKIIEFDCGGYLALIPHKKEAIAEGIYDLASLTKPIATAALFAKMQEDNIIDFNDKVSKYLPQFKQIEKANITILDLLIHTSGVKGWFPLYLEAENLQEAVNLIASFPLEHKPGKRVIYSCLGYIILTAILEKITGKNIQYLFNKLISSKLDLSSTFFNPDKNLKSFIAPTENTNNYERKLSKELNLNFHKYRDYLIWGEVHDSNCYFLGGLTGNSGLFSNIFDLYEIAKLFITPSPLFSDETLQFFYKNFTPFDNEHRSIGWKLASSSNTPAKSLSPSSIGHSGFTGTSLWIEPIEKNIYILLTNKIHPEVNNINMNNIRESFHKLSKEKINEYRQN